MSVGDLLSFACVTFPLTSGTTFGSSAIVPFEYAVSHRHPTTIKLIEIILFAIIVFRPFIIRARLAGTRRFYCVSLCLIRYQKALSISIYRFSDGDIPESWYEKSNTIFVFNIGMPKS
jgi:hypothetical protein